MKSKYSLFVVLGGVLWGTMGFFRRRLGEMGFDSVGAVFIRCAIAAILFAVTILIQNPGDLKIKPKDVWCFIGSGICSLLFFSVCYFQAINLMTLSTAAILLYTAPCFVILMSAVLFKERINRRKVLALFLAFAGCCLVSGIVGNESRITLAGLLYGLGSGFGYALYSIFGKLAFARGYKSTVVNFWAVFLAAIGAGIICGFRKNAGIMFSSPENCIFCLATGVVTCYLPYLFYMYGLTGTEAGKASVMASVEPVVATVVGVLLFKERLTIWMALGVIMVLSAIVILNTKTNERETT